MKSKLGFHIDIQGHHGQIEKMVRAETKIIKIISSMGMLCDLYRALGDKTIFIARDWKVTDDFLRFGGREDPKGAAARWVEGMRPAMVQVPFAYWESFNEMSNWDSLRQYGEFEAERQRLMAAEGFKACIGNFATGTPAVSHEDGDGREDVWPDFYPALEVAHELGNILGLHEYAGLWMDLWYGPNQSDELLSGNRVPFPEERYEGWLFARYRKVWRRHIEPNGWSNIRIALTEFGFDMAGTVDTDVLAGYTCGSWSTLGPAWSRLDGRNDAEDYYVEQLQWADRQMQKDPYLIGCTIFTWGTLGELWKDFEIQGRVADLLIDYIDQTEDEDDEPFVLPSMYVTPMPEDGLRVREGPSGDHPVVGLVHPGDKLGALERKEDVLAKLGRSGQWIKVRIPTGDEGYVAAWLSELYTGPQPHDPDPDKLYVTPVVARGVKVISGAAENFKTLTTVPLGEMVEVLDPEDEALPKIGEKNTWLKVRTARGINGWLSGEFIERVPTGEAPPEPDDKLYVRTTASDGLRIRSGPSAQHSPVTLVMPSDRMETIGDPRQLRAQLGKRRQWIHVRTPGDITGWGAAWLLEEAPGYFEWPVGHALVGLHGPTDIGEWTWDDEAYHVIHEAKIEAVKLISAGDMGGNVVARLRQQGVKFILARLFGRFSEQIPAERFVRENADTALRLYDAGIRYFEVHNEPNLHKPDSPEGMWVMWRNGKEFGDYFLESVRLLKNLMPGAQFGFPGLSPGGDEPNLRADSETFLAQAEAATREADFICMHTYWGPDGSTYLDSIAEVRAYCDRFPNKLIFVTEFSNPSENVNKDIKGREYVQFYTEARELPPNLGALFAFTLSAAEGFEHETWKGSSIVSRVGSRSLG